MWRELFSYLFYLSFAAAGIMLENNFFSHTPDFIPPLFLNVVLNLISPHYPNTTPPHMCVATGVMYPHSQSTTWSRV